MKFMRIVVSVLVLLAIALSLAGCGQTVAEPTAAPTEPPAAAQPTSAPPPTSVPPTAAPEPMTFTFCTGGDAVRLDPADFDDELSWLPNDHIFDPLTRIIDATGEPQPWLAERWESSPDLKEWTFYLRKDVKFSDGTPLNADTYLWSINRQWDPNHPFHKDEYATLGYYLWIDYMGFGLKGDPNAGVQDVVKVDDYTIKFVLKDPNPLFLKWTTTINFEPVSPASFEQWGTEAYQHPVGTGPYVLQEWVKDDHITLVKNPDSWCADKFPLDKIVFRVVTDAAARYLAVKAGDCQGMNLVSPDDAANAAKDPDLRFNMNEKPLDDKNVRLALAYAVDKQSIVDNLYSGLGEVATQWLGPLYNGYNPDVKGYPFDLEKAKEYLKAAGMEDGFTIDYWYMPVARPYFPNAKAVAEAVAADWAKIGVIANLKTEDWGQYLQDRSDGKFPVFMMGWTPDFIDGSVLSVWFQDVPLGSGLESKEAGFSSQEVNDLLAHAASTADMDARTKDFEQIEVIVNDIVPGVPVVHTSVPNIFAKNVHGFVPVPLKTDLLMGVTVGP
jgi:peptide/nickel transport system substrate-binding protein